MRGGGGKNGVQSMYSQSRVGGNATNWPSVYSRNSEGTDARKIMRNPRAAGFTIRIHYDASTFSFSLTAEKFRADEFRGAILA